MIVPRSTGQYSVRAFWSLRAAVNATAGETGTNTRHCLFLNFALCPDSCGGSVAARRWARARYVPRGISRTKWRPSQSLARIMVARRPHNGPAWSAIARWTSAGAGGTKTLPGLDDGHSLGNPALIRRSPAARSPQSRARLQRRTVGRSSSRGGPSIRRRDSSGTRARHSGDRSAPTPYGPPRREPRNGTAPSAPSRGGIAPQGRMRNAPTAARPIRARRGAGGTSAGRGSAPALRGPAAWRQAPDRHDAAARGSSRTRQPDGAYMPQTCTDPRSVLSLRWKTLSDHGTLRLSKITKWPSSAPSLSM